MLAEAIYQIAPYAPSVIFIAAALDIFFATALFLYGGALVASVLMLHSTGMVSTEIIFIVSYAGTVLGNLTNFAAGKFFHQTNLVQKALKHPKLATIPALIERRGLLLFVILGRSITLTRPFYALILGSLDTNFKKFIVYELFFAALWTGFWLLIILQGEILYSYLFQ